MDIAIHRRLDTGVAKQLLQNLRLHPAFNRACRIGMPIGYNKDKSGSSLIARGSGFVLILFPVKKGPELGSWRGGRKKTVHIKDKKYCVKNGGYHER